MATTILLVCPACKRQIKAPDNVFGKKVRCKYCQAAFVARKGADKPPPGKAAKPAKPAARADDDDDPNPYGISTLDLTPRCPECANELESADAVICLHCGYNTQTRERYKTRKVRYTTGGDWFLWLLPGIACALAVLALIGFNVWYLMEIDDLAKWEENSWYVGMWSVSGIKLWVVIMSLFFIWLAGKFAVKRLILHYRPPEIEKHK